MESDLVVEAPAIGYRSRVFASLPVLFGNDAKTREKWALDERHRRSKAALSRVFAAFRKITETQQKPEIDIR